jgi:hypothetical protein
VRVRIERKTTCRACSFECRLSLARGSNWQEWSNAVTVIHTHLSVSTQRGWLAGAFASIALGIKRGIADHCAVCKGGQSCRRRGRHGAFTAALAPQRGLAETAATGGQPHGQLRETTALFRPVPGLKHETAARPKSSGEHKPFSLIVLEIWLASPAGFEPAFWP